MLRIELREDSPGFAQLNARKWKGSNNVEFAIQRNQDSYYFLGNGNWGPEPVWHKAPNMNVVGDALQGKVGPWLIDSLVNQSGNVRFLLQIRDENIEDNGPINFIGNILASSAGGDSSRAENINEITETPIEPLIEPIEIKEEQPTVIEEPIIPEAITEPAPTIEKQPEKKSKIGLIIGLIILLLLLGIAAYFFFANKSNPTTTAAPTANLGECSVSNNADELAFVQACLKTKPDSKKILEVITQAKSAKKCGIAQRLYANQAQGGNADIAVAYAKEYIDGSECFAVNKDNAIYWYETALSIDPNNEAAKKGLAELKK